MIVFFSLVLSMAALEASVMPISKEQWLDRVKGALVGSVIGDTLGRITEPMETSAAIKEIYGKNGISSVKQIASCQLLYEPFKYKAAAYSGNTVQALLTFRAGIKGRKKKYSYIELTDNIARGLIDLFFAQKYMKDPHFSFRKYSNATLKAVEKLTECVGHNQQSWWRGKKDIKKSCQVFFDNESSMLARVWPLGLLFADDINKVAELSAYQAHLTSDHPAAIAASTAIASGVAAAVLGDEPDEIINKMIRACGINNNTDNHYLNVASSSCDLVSKVKMGQEISDFGRGYLADEALARTAYIFLQHSDDCKGAITAAVNGGGRTALIGSLVGALVGAHCGFEKLKSIYGTEIDMLENIQGIYATVDNFEHVIKCECNSWWQKSIRATILVGTLGLIGYYTYKHI